MGLHAFERDWNGGQANMEFMLELFPGNSTDFNWWYVINFGKLWPLEEGEERFVDFGTFPTSVGYLSLGQYTDLRTNNK